MRNGKSQFLNDKWEMTPLMGRRGTRRHPCLYPHFCELRESSSLRSDGLIPGRRVNANGVKITWTLPIANSTLRIVLQGVLSTSLFLPVNGQWASGNGQ